MKKESLYDHSNLSSAPQKRSLLDRVLRRHPMEIHVHDDLEFNPPLHLLSRDQDTAILVTHKPTQMKMFLIWPYDKRLLRYGQKAIVNRLIKAATQKRRDRRLQLRFRSFRSTSRKNIAIKIRTRRYSRLYRNLEPLIANDLMCQSRVIPNHSQRTGRF